MICMQNFFIIAVQTPFTWFHISSWINSLFPQENTDPKPLTQL
jgi:hypothetical protein